MRRRELPLRTVGVGGDTAVDGAVSGGGTSSGESAASGWKRSRESGGKDNSVSVGASGD